MGTPLRLEVSMCSPEMMDCPAVELPLGAPALIFSVSVPPTATSCKAEVLTCECWQQRILMLAVVKACPLGMGMVRKGQYSMCW